jgi:hypothetical protein
VSNDLQYCLSPQQTGCDVICLVYDASNPRSFEYCARIYLVSLKKNDDDRFLKCTIFRIRIQLLWGSRFSLKKSGLNQETCQIFTFKKSKRFFLTLKKDFTGHNRNLFFSSVAEPEPPDPEPHQNFYPEPEPHENDAAPQHCFSLFTVRSFTHRDNLFKMSCAEVLCHHAVAGAGGGQQE